MNRLAALLLAAVLLVGSVSAIPAAASAASTTVPASSSALQADVNATNVTPGQRLAGVIGAGQAEFEGAVEQRAFGIEYALASSNASKADVVKDRLDAVRERLAELEQRKAALEQARENGSISEGEYRARVTALAARSEQVRELANASEARAGSLPDDVLASKGINVSSIRTLQAQAANLTGQEVAEIARSIAGPSVGRTVGGPPDELIRPDAPGDRGDADANASADDARVAISSAQERISAAQERVATANERAGSNPGSDVAEAIEDAEADLERAQAALDRAQAALDDGDAEAAIEHAEDAMDAAEDAEAHAQSAIDQAGQRGGQQTGTGDGS